MTWLELWEFVQALPHDAMTKAVAAGDHGLRRWTETDYLLRGVHDHLQYLVQVSWVGHRLQGKPPDFVSWPLPDLRSPEEIEEEQRTALERSTKARRFIEATKPGAQDPEYAKKLAAAREEHLRLAVRPSDGEAVVSPDK
ncbi:hypothetical protein [Streptomyces sp. CO7]